MISWRHMVKTFVLSLLFIFIWSFFAKVPVDVKVRLMHGSDLWGVTETLGHPGKHWPALYEVNKDKVTVMKIDSEAEGYAMTFFNEGEIVVLPAGWKARDINLCKIGTPRVKIVEGPYAPFWAWVYKKILG